jgi:hypothetical protein
LDLCPTFGVQFTEAGFFMSEAICHDVVATHPAELQPFACLHSEQSLFSLAFATAARMTLISASAEGFSASRISG